MSAKSRIAEKKFEPRIKHSYYYTTHDANQKESRASRPIRVGHRAACQNSISSLFVQAESRHKKYKRNKRNLDSWIVERSDSSSSEEEQILTCMSMEKTYTTSTEGGVNYLAARMRNICDDAKPKERSRKYVFVRNKGTQSDDIDIDNSGEIKKIECAVPPTLDKVDAATETPVGLIDKEYFSSPLSGNAYKINIPELAIPQDVYPHVDKMFDFISATDLKTQPVLENETEHQKLLSAIYDALLSSTERPVMNHYYDKTFKVHKQKFSNDSSKNKPSEVPTKKLFVAPQMFSSSSNYEFSSSENTKATSAPANEIEFSIKRKSSSTSVGSDILPPKSPKKSVKEPKRRILTNNRKTRSNTTSRSSSFEVNETLPVILEDVYSSNNVRKMQNYTNPFLQKTPRGSSVCNYCKLARASAQSSQNTINNNSFTSQKAEENTKTASRTSVAKHLWNVTLNSTPKNSWKSNIPVPVSKTVSMTKKRKL